MSMLENRQLRCFTSERYSVLTLGERAKQLAEQLRSLGIDSNTIS